MKDIPEYITLHKERNKLKARIKNLTGRDFSSILKRYDQRLASVIGNADSLTITTSDFKSLVIDLMNEVNKTGNLNLSAGRSEIISLQDDIKKALDFKYPIDYQLLPKVNQDSLQLQKEIGTILENYRKGKLSESVMRRSLQGRMHQPVNVTNTYVNTQLAGFDNSASRTIGELAGLDKYMYLGPLNANTREFCQILLESRQLYTERQILAMDNGQGIPVIRYCGGYNCLHEWMMVSESWGEIKEIFRKAA